MLNGALVLVLTLFWLLGLAAPAGTPARAQGDGPALSAPLAPQADLGTAFNYQGQLKTDGDPVDGACDFRFSLYDAASDGAQVGVTLEREGVALAEGLFSVALDFGADAFHGDARWLEIAVRCAGDGDYTSLGRQALTAAPQALYALGAPWSGLTGVPAGFADGVDDVGAAWSLSGNSDTTPGTHFMGTTDDVPLELRVNGAPTLRLEPNATSPNLIAGHSSNSVSAGAPGATVGGGGSNLHPNRIEDDFATVSGGSGNTASGLYGTISGGHRNTTIGPVAAVGGGWTNAAVGWYATIPGGYENEAAGDYSFAAGRQAKANHDGAFVWADATDADFGSTAANQMRVRVASGAYITSANGSYGLTVINAGSGDAVRARANTSDAYNAALHATNGGTSAAVWADSGGTYSGFFLDSIYVAGSVDATALVQLGVNDTVDALAPGDLVTVAGLGSPLAGTEAPLLRVRRAGSGDAVIGVVHTRADIVSSSREGVLLESAQRAEGMVATGEHLFIVMFGIADVKVDASAGDIAVGQRLTAAETAGRARALRTATLDGMLVTEGAPVVGVALAAPTAESDTIPVFVTLR
jgi:hypothetical protein